MIKNKRRIHGSLKKFSLTLGAGKTYSAGLLKQEFPNLRHIREYGIALLVIGFIGGVCFFSKDFIGYHGVAIILLFGVSLLPLWVSRGPVLVSAAMSALIWNYFFIPPLYTFHVEKLEDQLTLGMYFIIALVTGSLTAKVRSNEKALRFREERAIALYSLSKDLSGAVTEAEVLKAAVDNIEQFFSTQCCIILSSDDPVENNTQFGSLLLTHTEKIAADWALANKQKAGKFTINYPLSENQYFPIMAPRGFIGIISISKADNRRFSSDEENLLDTFLNQIGSALEREKLNESANKAVLLSQSEHLYTTLLNSISHELRTPIAAIIGASSGLQDPQTSRDESSRQALTKEIEIAAHRLNRLVENLLDMTRLESGMMKIHRDWCDISDVLNVAIQQLKGELAQHTIHLSIEPELPLLQLDFVLIEQAITNILHNAALYTPENGNIYISAKKQMDICRITIEDNGPGIPEKLVSMIFEKFYRPPGSKAGGTGLGLSISKGLIEAHGGTVTAENRPNGGARFIIDLPYTEKV